MKKIFLISVCASVLSLTACEKKQVPEQSSTAPTEVTATDSAAPETTANTQPAAEASSQDNQLKLSQDFALIQNLNLEKTAEAQPIANKLQQAIASGDNATRDATATELNNKRVEINKALEQLPLKSAEGDQLRKSSIELNLLAIELGNEGFKTPVNEEKIKSLMQQVNELQANIQQQVADIEAKVSP